MKVNINLSSKQISMLILALLGFIDYILIFIMEDSDADCPNLLKRAIYKSTRAVLGSKGIFATFDNSYVDNKVKRGHVQSRIA